jgi:hypothetical protein
MRVEAFSFWINPHYGITYDHDVVLDQGRVRKRSKRPSQEIPRGIWTHASPIEEQIPWNCNRLMVGTGTGVLPVMDEVREEARRRKIKLLIFPTVEAIQELRRHPRDTNAILHVTC